jgi:hypothetical protein
MCRAMSALLIRIVGALAAGFLFSQSSEFTQQYLQRLGGAADELRTVVQRFDDSARLEGLQRDAAIERLRSASDSFVARQGNDAASLVARQAAVERRYAALTNTAPLLRPFAALADPDWPIMGRAFDDFRPALPISADGVFLTVAGFAGGWGLGAGVAGVHAIRRRRRIRRAAVGGPTGGSRLA